MNTDSTPPAPSATQTPKVDDPAGPQQAEGKRRKPGQTDKDASDAGDGVDLRRVEGDAKAPKAADVGDSVQFGENLTDYSNYLFEVNRITPNVPDTTLLAVDLDKVSESATQIERALSTSADTYKSKISIKLPEEDRKKIANYLFQSDAQLESDIAKQLTKIKLERKGTPQQKEMITITKPSDYVPTYIGGDAKENFNDILGATKALGLNRLGDENLERLSRVRLAYLTGNAYAKALRDFVDAQQSSRDRKEETSRQKTGPGSRGATPTGAASAGGVDRAAGGRRPANLPPLPNAPLPPKDSPSGDNPPPAGNPATGTSQDGSAATQDDATAGGSARRRPTPLSDDVDQQLIPAGAHLIIAGQGASPKTSETPYGTVTGYKIGSEPPKSIDRKNRPKLTDGWKNDPDIDKNWQKYISGKSPMRTPKEPSFDDLGDISSGSSSPASSDSGFSVDGSSSEDDTQLTGRKPKAGPRTIANRAGPKEAATLSGSRPQSPARGANPGAQDGGAQGSSGGRGSGEVSDSRAQVTKRLEVQGKKEQKESAFKGEIVQGDGPVGVNDSRAGADEGESGAVSGVVAGPIAEVKLQPRPRSAERQRKVEKTASDIPAPVPAAKGKDIAPKPSTTSQDSTPTERASPQPAAPEIKALPRQVSSDDEDFGTFEVVDKGKTIKQDRPR